MRGIALCSVVILAAVVLTGCGLIYTGVRVPRAYRSASPADVKASPADRPVTGESCYRSLLYLVAWGDASYAAATASALREDPGATLYDVKVDARATSVLLGLYTRVCTVVTGKVGRP